LCGNMFLALNGSEGLVPSLMVRCPEDSWNLIGVVLLWALTSLLFLDDSTVNSPLGSWKLMGVVSLRESSSRYGSVGSWKLIGVVSLNESSF